MHRENRLQNTDTSRVAVITGGAQGIGRRTAELLAERNYRLAVIDLHHPEETVQVITAAGGEALGYSGDITHESVVKEFAHLVFRRYGGWASW